MRLKKSESEFSDDTTECWDGYGDNYVQFAWDSRMTDVQTLQYRHNLLRKDTKRFYSNLVVPHAATFQQAVDHISAKYNSPVRQSRVKHYLHGMLVKNLIFKSTKASEALSMVYKTIF